VLGMPTVHVCFVQGDVWLCMEVMDLSLDKFYRVLDSEGRRIPENVLRKIAVDVRCYWYVIIIINEYYYGGTVALLLQDHLTVSLSRFAD